MQIIPITTPLIQKGNDLAAILQENATLQHGDIIAISSKVIATAEGAEIDLETITISEDAKRWAEKTKRSPAFMQAVLHETLRMNGTIVGDCLGALLTHICPSGLQTGMILSPNAGLDESNIAQGKTIGWPIDPVTSASQLKKALETEDVNLGVLITDSFCIPRRMGVLAFALVAAGFEPLKSEIGSLDLFGRTMNITVEATADQLATAANIVMGNAAQSTPAVIIRDHGILLSDFCGWVNGIDPEDDLFRSIFRT